MTVFGEESWNDASDVVKKRHGWKCVRCRKGHNPDEGRSLVQLDLGGSWMIVCPQCRAALDLGEGTRTTYLPPRADSDAGPEPAGNPARPTFGNTKLG